MEKLPLEVLSYIVRHITHVPEALDTSFDTTIVEDRQRITILTRESLRHKSSLSLVSKGFNSIMQLIMYEHVVITQFKYVPVLLDHLRDTPQGYSRPRGHTCRRLDICLGVRGSPKYNDEEWYEGGHTLWGLIPACPNLEVLLAYILKPDPKHNIAPHLTHNSLWKTISTYLARTLRRIELYGFSIRMDRVEMMLRYLTRLEVVHIFHCKVFHDLHFPRLSNGEAIDREEQEFGNTKWYPDVYDDEEPSFRTHYFYDNRYRIDTIPQPSRDDEGRVRRTSKWFRIQDIVDFRRAKYEAFWPPWDKCSKPPYLLPHVHTLTLNIFTHRFFQFNLPSLRSIHISTMDSTFMFKHYPSGGGGTYIPSGPLLPTHTKRQPKRSRRELFHVPSTHFSYHDSPFKSPTMPLPSPPLHTAYTYLPFPTTPNSTLFGPYPPCITHLNLYCGSQCGILAPINQILYFFPNVTDLSWEVRKPENHFDDRINRIGPFTEPHIALRNVTIHYHGRQRTPRGKSPRATDENSEWESEYAEREFPTRMVVRGFLNAMQNGWIVNLTEVVVGVWEKRFREFCDDEENGERLLPYKKCRRLGVSVTIRRRRKADWMFFEHDYHIGE